MHESVASHNEWAKHRAIHAQPNEAAFKSAVIADVRVHVRAQARSAVKQQTKSNGLLDCLTETMCCTRTSSETHWNF